VLHVRSSTNLAAAYGLSVSGVMLSTSIAMTAVARLYWKWHWPVIVLVFGPLAAIDVSFLSANSLKFFEGGYIPLSLGIVLFVVMTTWRWGRRATFAAYSGKHTMTMKQLVALKDTAPLFDRNALVMAPKPIASLEANVPALMQLLYDRSGTLPTNILFVEVVHKKVPFLDEEQERYDVKMFQRAEKTGCVASVTVFFGFMEEPNVERVLESLAGHHQIDLPADPHKWIVHASHENVMAAKGLGVLGRMRLRLFAILRQVSQPAYYYSGLGNEVQLTTEIMPVKLR
jgi:KUP system potassium uptake protein